jgi:hypothetical protein
MNKRNSLPTPILAFSNKGKTLAFNKLERKKKCANLILNKETMRSPHRTKSSAKNFKVALKALSLRRLKKTTPVYRLSRKNCN